MARRFRRRRCHAPRAAGKVDHLSNVVRRGEFLSWSLFYRPCSVSRRSRRWSSPIRTAPFSAACWAVRTANCALRSTSARAAQPASRAFSTPWRRRLPADRAVDRRYFLRRRGRESERRRLPADPRQLLRRPRDALRYRARPARAHARAWRALRSRRGWRFLPHLHARLPAIASSSRLSSGAATTCSAPPTRRYGWPRRPASPTR